MLTVRARLFPQSKKLKNNKFCFIQKQKGYGGYLGIQKQ
jgi:hypothetical protein